MKNSVDTGAGWTQNNAKYVASSVESFGATGPYLYTFPDQGGKSDRDWVEKLNFLHTEIHTQRYDDFTMCEFNDHQIDGIRPP